MREMSETTEVRTPRPPPAHPPPRRHLWPPPPLMPKVDISPTPTVVLGLVPHKQEYELFSGGGFHNAHMCPPSIAENAQPIEPIVLFLW